MRFPRSVVEKIVREELAAHLKTLIEAPQKDEPGAEVVDAESQPDKKAPNKDPNPKSKAGVKPPDSKELPVGDEPQADQDLEKDVAAGDDVEDAEEVTGGKIADQITNKTLQSITMEPKSKTLPGAQEIVLTFKEIPDPLKILVTKTGQVKYFFKGLHNEV